MLKPGSQARHQTSVWTGRWVTRPWRWSTRPRARTTWAAPHGSANTRSTAAGCAFTPRCGEARAHIHTYLAVILAQTCWVTWHKYSFLHKWFWQWVVNRLRSAAVSITSCRRLNHTYFSVVSQESQLSYEIIPWKPCSDCLHKVMSLLTSHREQRSTLVSNRLNLNVENESWVCYYSKSKGSAQGAVFSNINIAFWHDCVCGVLHCAETCVWEHLPAIMHPLTSSTFPVI